MKALEMAQRSDAQKRREKETDRERERREQMEMERSTVQDSKRGSHAQRLM